MQMMRPTSKHKLNVRTSKLENAKKEKVRTYVAGIGFTYQENKAKVKEAK